MDQLKQVVRMKLQEIGHWHKLNIYIIYIIYIYYLLCLHYACDIVKLLNPTKIADYMAKTEIIMRYSNDLARTATY